MKATSKNEAIPAVDVTEAPKLEAQVEPAAPVLPAESPAAPEEPPSAPRTPLEEIEAAIAQVEQEFRQMEANLNRNRGVLTGLMFAKKALGGENQVAP